jgi:hypothetical protein
MPEDTFRKLQIVKKKEGMLNIWWKESQVCVQNQGNSTHYIIANWRPIQLTLPNPSFKLFDVRKTGFEHSIYSSAHKLTGGHLIPKENVRNKLGLELKLVAVNQYYYLIQILSYLSF